MSFTHINSEKLQFDFPVGVNMVFTSNEEDTDHLLGAAEKAKEKKQRENKKLKKGKIKLISAGS